MNTENEPMTAFGYQTLPDTHYEDYAFELFITGDAVNGSEDQIIEGCEDEDGLMVQIYAPSYELAVIEAYNRLSFLPVEWDLGKVKIESAYVYSREEVDGEDT